MLAAAGTTGLVVGVAIAAFERLADVVVLYQVLRAPLWVQVLAPGVGLVVAVALLRTVAGRASPSTADEYVRAFHDRRGHLPLGVLPGRLLAGVATVGSGGALGLEGPSIYAGATIGSNVQHRLSRWFRRDDAKVLLVCGAAAGVAAIFKAPATGVIFALEVPYTDDVARRALIPALVASAVSYLTFVTLVGAEPLFALRAGRGDDFGLADLGGALLLGVLAGGLARGFAWLVQRAKRVSATAPLLPRLAGGALALGGLALLTDVVFGEPLSLGPGYAVFDWVADADRTLVLIAALFAIRAAATVVTLGAGGTGGLFIPLAVQGMLLGRFVAGAFGTASSTLFPVIGLAAFLGAGYRTPIASVMFVAETTGRALYVVPALVAAAASQLVMGRATVASGQQSVRSGHLERRFRLPLSTALTTEVLPVPPGASVAELVWTHVVARRERAVAVVDGDR
jgi:chloride channel protein, CIC family